MLLRLTLILASAWLLGACAIGNTYDYRGQMPELELGTDKTVSVAVVDQREYVLSGEKEPDFIGLQRGGFGNPFDVTTKSGGPLADDMSHAVVQSLEARGVTARSVTVLPTANSSAARTAVLADNPARALLIYLREWKSDTMFNIALIYDLEAEVLDSNGNRLGGNKLSANEDIGGDAVNPLGYAEIHVPKAFARVFGQLLANPEITSALE